MFDIDNIYNRIIEMEKEEKCMKINYGNKIIYLEGKPQPKQEMFFNANARHVAYGGARGKHN